MFLNQKFEIKSSNFKYCRLVQDKYVPIYYLDSILQ